MTKEILLDPCEGCPVDMGKCSNCEPALRDECGDAVQLRNIPCTQILQPTLKDPCIGGDQEKLTCCAVGRCDVNHDDES